MLILGCFCGLELAWDGCLLKPSLLPRRVCSTAPLQAISLGTVLVEWDEVCATLKMVYPAFFGEDGGVRGAWGRTLTF